MRNPARPRKKAVALQPQTPTVEAPKIVVPSESEMSSIVSEIIAGAPTSFSIPKDAIILPAHGFKCRPYQTNFWRYMVGEDGQGDGKKKFAVLNWHRRAGKDALILNLIAYLTTRRRGMYWHGFPLLNQARRAIWEGFMNSESRRMLDYLPKELREDSNQQELRINLKTGSTYQLVGGDNPDKLTGSGPIGIAFSEYAQTSEAIWDYTSPILGENDGWVVFISTPRGKNHFHKIYQYALSTPGCYAETLTIDDTWYIDSDGQRRPVVSQEYIEKLIKQGKSMEFIRQEFYCDWNSAVEGAVYALQLKELEAEQRYGYFPWIPELPVCTAWDLGYRDSTAVGFFQIEPNTQDIRVIDFYSKAQKPMKHFCDMIRSKPYRYNTHYAPWDVTNRSLHQANSIMDVAREHGVMFQRLMKSGVADGIEAVRAMFPRIKINKATCEPLVDALKAYTYQYDEAQKQFGTEPQHDWASHPADMMRYMGAAIPIIRPGTMSWEISRQHQPTPAPDQAPWDILPTGE